MTELANCATCQAVFLKSSYRDVCDECYKEEEEIFASVSEYLRRRENKLATNDEIIGETAVRKELFYRWIETGRSSLHSYPNLGLVCRRCHALTRKGIICEACAKELQKELLMHE